MRNTYFQLFSLSRKTCWEIYLSSLLPLIQNFRHQGSSTVGINLTTNLETLCLVLNPTIRRHGSHKLEIHKNVSYRILKAKYLLERLCKTKKKLEQYIKNLQSRAYLNASKWKGSGLRYHMSKWSFNRPHVFLTRRSWTDLRTYNH